MPGAVANEHSRVQRDLPLVIRLAGATAASEVAEAPVPLGNIQSSADRPRAVTRSVDETLDYIQRRTRSMKPTNRHRQPGFRWIDCSHGTESDGICRWRPWRLPRGNNSTRVTESNFAAIYSGAVW